MAAVAVIASCLAVAPPAPAATSPSQLQLVRIVDNAFASAGPAVEAQAVCVARHESSGPAGLLIPTAYSGDQDGLFEIDEFTWNPSPNQYRAGGNPAAIKVVGHISWARIFEPAYNAMVAFRIWKHSGWLPAWTADEGACGL